MLEASKISELEADCGRGSSVAVRGDCGVFCFLEGTEGTHLPDSDCVRRDHREHDDGRYFRLPDAGGEGRQHQRCECGGASLGRGARVRQLVLRKLRDGVGRADCAAGDEVLENCARPGD